MEKEKSLLAGNARNRVTVSREGCDGGGLDLVHKYLFILTDQRPVAQICGQYEPRLQNKEKISKHFTDFNVPFLSLHLFIHHF